jgi:hypothetical protein
MKLYQFNLLNHFFSVIIVKDEYTCLLTYISITKDAKQRFTRFNIKIVFVLVDVNIPTFTEILFQYILMQITQVKYNRDLKKKICALNYLSNVHLTP